MNKILKLTSIFIAILALLIVLAVILLMTFVSPNRLKPVLTQQISQAFGREFQIEGDLSWTFFPYLGVDVGRMVLHNPENFADSTFAEIDSATVGVRVLPLFKRQIKSSGVTLKGLKLHLVKNSKGQVNWNLVPSSAPPETPAPESSSGSTSSKPLAGLVIAGLHVIDASVTYQDQVENQSYTINHFELDAKHINLIEPFPIKSSFDFANSTMSGHVVLSSDAALNLATQIYSFRHLDFSAKVQKNNKKFNIYLLGDVLVNLDQQILQWTNLQGQLANMKLQGKLTISNLIAHPVTNGEIKVIPFDLKEMLLAIGERADSLDAAKDASGDVNFSIDNKDVNATGDISIESLEAAKLNMNHFKIKFHMQNNILDLAPFSANLYQGTLVGTAKIDLQNSALPKIALEAKLADIQAEPLLQDLSSGKQKIKIAGTAYFDADVTTVGKDSTAILGNLNGTSRFNFKDGAIIGVDLGYLVDSAYQLVKQQTITATNHNRTNFGNLTGTAVIHQGVLTNNDLVSDSPRFTIQGKGSIDLVNQKMDYTLSALLKAQSEQKDNLMNLYGITIPVLIKGNLQDPSVRLDSATLGKAIAVKQLEKVRDDAKQKIEDQLEKKLPDVGNLLKGTSNKELQEKAQSVLNNLLGQ